MSTTNSSRKSYLLSVTPVDYSLTDGTNIPPPAAEELPQRTPSRSSLAEPPTPGGGPLTSHPATPADSLKGATRSPEPTWQPTHDRRDSFASPTSPVSPNAPRPKGVRKLLSLSNLRSSFSSSRTSLSLPRQSHDASTQVHNNLKRPSSPGAASSLAPSTVVSVSGPNAPTNNPYERQPLRSRKSGGNWFKRKSSLFLLNPQGELDTVEENRPESSGKRTKRFKEMEKERSPAPMLPELGRLGVEGGGLGWDDQAFKRDVVA